MKLQKLFLATAIMTLGYATTATAQSANTLDYTPYPYMFIGVQGGTQTTFTKFNQDKTFTPTGSFSIGAFFTPTFGVRLHTNGIWNKARMQAPGLSDPKYKYKYFTTDLDLLLNLCTMFGAEEYYRMNVYLIGGAGLNYTWDKEDLSTKSKSQADAWEDKNTSINARLGAMLDYNLSKHWSINLEANANMLAPLGKRSNSQFQSNNGWQLTAQLGLAYKFGLSRKVKTAPIAVGVIEDYNDDQNAAAAHARMLAEQAARRKAAEEAAARAAELAATQQPKAIATTQKDIFFSIGSAVIRESETSKVQDIIDWLKDNPSARATITGHADAGTGNPTVNAIHAQNRAEAVAKAITNAGIDAARLTIESKGDTVMPYGDSEKSRVAIIVGTGE